MWVGEDEASRWQSGESLYLYSSKSSELQTSIRMNVFLLCGVWQTSSMQRKHQNEVARHIASLSREFRSSKFKAKAAEHSKAGWRSASSTRKSQYLTCNYCRDWMAKSRIRTLHVLANNWQSMVSSLVTHTTNERVQSIYACIQNSWMQF